MENIGGVNVSRETYDKLEAYASLLFKWNRTINLVAKSTISEFWERHVVDSAQLCLYSPKQTQNWVDIGSGGGLPGVVVATILQEKQAQARITLIESDQRKAAFLRTTVRELGLNAQVQPHRVEDVDPQECDVLSARALASVSGLLHSAEGHLAPHGVALFLKGRNFQKEINEARTSWDFDVVAHPSITDNEARVLEIRNISRANA